MKPLCFDNEEQYAEWCDLAIQSKITIEQYCRDCTPKYQREMVAADRCKHPETFFYLHKIENEFDLVGYNYGNAALSAKVETEQDMFDKYNKKFFSCGHRGRLIE